MVSGLPHYVWEVPGKPISIQLPFDVIDRMSPEILRGFGALKRRGAEVGGILLGRCEQGPPRRVVIQDFEIIPSEYLTGPSYNLSENDLVSFEAALERRRPEDESGLAVVGFFRSHTRDELYLDEADLGVASRYFPGPENVFLLVKPFASRPCIGGFFFWEEGEIYRESTYLQFPFDRKELGGGEAAGPALHTTRAEPESQPLPPYAPTTDKDLVLLPPPHRFWESRPQDSLSIPGAPEGSRITGLSWRWLLVPTFLMVASVTGFFAYRNLDSSKAAPSPGGLDTPLPLKLSVAEKQRQLDVTWDRNAPSIARAKRGVLSISDGSNRRDIELSGAQLRNGRVLYSRLSGDVNLRLEVFPEGEESVNESIRIVSGDAAKPPEPPVAPQKRRVDDAPMKRRSAPARAKTKATHLAPRAASRPTAPPATIKTDPVEPVPAPPAEVELQRPKRRP
jgi:hypothetical protein